MNKKKLFLYLQECIKSIVDKFTMASNNLSTNASNLQTSGGLNNLKPPRLHGTPGAITLHRYFASDMHIYYGTVSPLISIFIISINFLLIVTLIKGKFRMSTHVMMISIAMADSFIGLVPLPFNVYAFGLKLETDYLSVTWCYVYEYMQKILPEILHLSSIHLTVGLGVERFIVVAFPLKAKRICTFRNGAIFSTIIFILSICSQIDLLTKASFKEFTIRHNTSNSTISGCLRSELIRTNTEYILRIVFLVFLPCLILVIFTILLLKKSKEIQQWRNTNIALAHRKSPTVNSLERLDLAVVLIMFCIVCTEVTVWTAFLISRVYNIRFTKVHTELVALGHIMFQITCPINFIVLCVLSSRFRDVLKDTTCCCLTQRRCSCLYKDRQHESKQKTRSESKSPEIQLEDNAV